MLKVMIMTLVSGKLVIFGVEMSWTFSISLAESHFLGVLFFDSSPEK